MSVSYKCDAKWRAVLELSQDNTELSPGGWRPAYLDKSENVPWLWNAWGGVLNGQTGVGGWGLWAEALFVPCKEGNDIIGQLRRKHPPPTSKNWIGWCGNNWRKGKLHWRDPFSASASVSIFLQLFTPWLSSTLQPSVTCLPPAPTFPSVVSFPPLILFACGPEALEKNAGQETVISWHHYFLFLSPVSSSYRSRCTPSKNLSCSFTRWGQHCSVVILGTRIF